MSLLGVFLTGANLAFIVHAPHLFPSESVRFWRIFFAGKALASVILVAVLYTRRSEEFTWPTAASAISFVLVLYALGMIWIKRPYKYVVVKPELLDDEARDEAIRQLRQTRPAPH